MDLPGFQIEREIGRGGMARVYLAVQRKFGRLVALKVVSEQFAKHQDFRSRFLEESRINAQLVHPNIVQVYDVASHDDYIYLVMEYLSGGDLNQKLAKGMHLQAVLKVVKDIGRALDHAHQKGVIHRDIKPENILFREDGSAVLTDFGIARAVLKGAALTRTGTVVGTPQYMSPEQAAGRDLDGRSDLYSLGIVFYRMLTGDVPFKAETAVAVGVKHLQEPVPRLPAYLAAFQDVIDQALAKKAGLRFQSGAELANALDRIRSDAELPNTTIKTEAVTTQEIRAVAASMLTTMRDPRRAERKSSRRRRRNTIRTALVAAFAVFAVALGGYWVYERPDDMTRLLAMVGLANSPGLQEAWNEAQALQADPNQGLAAVVAGYRRVLDIDPQHDGASAGLIALADKWHEDIEEGIVSSAYAAAQSKLEEARLAFPDDDRFAQLSETLEQRQRADTLVAGTKELLGTDADIDAADAAAAIQAYQEALRFAPGHQAALEELDRLAALFTARAMDALDDGDLESAIASLDRASTANADHVGLQAARDRIQQANTTRGAIDQMIVQAEEHREAGNLISPSNGNAAGLYHQVLSIDPSNPRAAAGLREIVTQVRADVRQQLANGAFERASQIVESAANVNLDANAVAELRGALAQEQSRVGNVERLLITATEHLANGYLTLPEGDNAASALREVRRLDPQNSRAQELEQQVAGRLAEVAQDAFDAGLAREASNYMELALSITPGVAEWQQLQRTWNASAANASAADGR